MRTFGQLQSRGSFLRRSDRDQQVDVWQAGKDFTEFLGNGAGTRRQRRHESEPWFCSRVRGSIQFEIRQRRVVDSSAAGGSGSSDGTSSRFVASRNNDFPCFNNDRYICIL